MGYSIEDLGVSIGTCNASGMHTLLFCVIYGARVRSKLALACMVANWSHNHDSARRTRKDSQQTAGTQMAGDRLRRLLLSSDQWPERLQILGTILAGDKYTAEDKTIHRLQGWLIDLYSACAPMEPL